MEIKNEVREYSFLNKEDLIYLKILNVEDNNLNSIVNFVIENLNCLVLNNFEVNLLLGIHSIIEDDYYYICKDPKGKISYSTCLITLIPLKGKIDNLDYTYIERDFIQSNLRSNLINNKYNKNHDLIKTHFDKQ